MTKAVSRNGNCIDEFIDAYDKAMMDLQMMCDTLTKLLEFDENFVFMMLDCGLLGSFIDDMLDLIMIDVMNVNLSADSDVDVQHEYHATPTSAP